MLASAAAIVAFVAAAVPPAEPLPSLKVDEVRLGRMLTLFDEQTVGTARTLGALTLVGGVVAIGMGATAKYAWHEQLGGSYAMIGGALSSATGLLLLSAPSPLQAIRLRFESERGSSPDAAVANALESWRRLVEQGNARRETAIRIQIGVGAAAALAGIAAVATPWFDRYGSSYARHTFAEAFIPVGAALVAGGITARRMPPSVVELGYQLAAGVVPLPGGAAAGVQGTF
jgi:hypothetical protein